MAVLFILLAIYLENVNFWMHIFSEFVVYREIITYSL